MINEITARTHHSQETDNTFNLEKLKIQRKS